MQFCVQPCDPVATLAVSFNALDDLRQYEGSETAALVKYRTTFGDGGGGSFAVKPGDTTDDDGALVIEDALGRRWWRIYDGAWNAKWWGAKGDGVTDDTAALQACLDALPVFQAELYIPAGDYLTGPLVLPVIYNFTIEGGGRETTNLSLTSAGTLLMISGANFSTIKGIGFRLSGIAQGIAGTIGVRVCNQSGNCTFNGCDFVGFSDDGLFFDGTVATSTASSISGTVLTVGGTITGTFAVGQTINGGARGTIITSLGTGTGGAGTYNVTVFQTVGTTAIMGAFEMSGHKVNNCYFLGNGRHQLHGFYSNDFVFDVNQVGKLPGIPHAQTGIRLEWCGAGFFNKNTSWENVIGVRMSDCDYNSVSDNRIEINDKEGLIIERGFSNEVQLNRGYSNSQSGNSLFDNYRFVDTTGLFCCNNKIFTWNATITRYGIAVEGTCSNLQIKNNQIDGFDSVNYGPFKISAATLETGINCDDVLRFATVGMVAAGATVWVGVNGEQDAMYKTGFQLGAGRWQCIGAKVLATSGPGISESFTYTVASGFSDSPMTASITGSVHNTFIASTEPTVNMSEGTFPSMKIVASPGVAPAAAHRGYMNLLQY